jgi:beta-mannosidase
MRSKLLIIVSILLCSPALSQIIYNTLTPLNWQLGYSSDAGVLPNNWISSMVPGSVQTDIARSENWGHFYYAENWKKFLPLEDKFYTYKTNFTKSILNTNDRVYFISMGIDYEFTIYLNDERLFHQEGMFTPVKLDLTSRLKDMNELRIEVMPAPKSHAFPLDRSQADHSVKPAVSYGWDWHPRLIPLGIWDETGLSIESNSYIEEFSNHYALNSTLDQAILHISLSGRSLKQCSFIWSLTDDSGRIILKKEGDFDSDQLEFSTDLINPILWWPHDQGTAYLYNSNIILLDKKHNNLQTLSREIGFRKIKLVLSSGSESDPEGFPKSRRLAPIQMQVNGRNIFCKGTNWLNPEIFPGTITQSRYHELLEKVVEANFNILRVWGGGIVNKDPFFKLCDEMGILVWQEFPLACNNYPDDNHYLEILKQEATSIIKRVREHASLALWCGGNELFNSWSGMTDQSLALRLLNALCLELDPATPFNATSPLQGMGHGHYVFRDPDTNVEIFERMNKAKFSAYTEFGVPGPSSVEILKMIIPVNELWPPRPGGSWESHHAFNAWTPDTWLMQKLIESYFGKSANLEELVDNGQLIQGEGYKYIFEEARRQKPFCSMAINWCFNEPWPTAANNSIVSYPALNKPAFYEIKNACRPFLASARFAKFQWKAGEEFKIELWALNDSPSKYSALEIKVYLQNGIHKLPIGHWDFPGTEANENLKGPVLSCTIPDWPNGLFKLIIEVPAQPAFNSEYKLLLKNNQDQVSSK